MEIFDVLTSWTEMVVDERRLPTRPRRTVSDQARFLNIHLHWLAHHFAGGDFVDELDAAVTAGRHAVESMGMSVTKADGPRGCPVPDCDGSVVVHRRTSRGRQSVEVACTRGHRFNTDDSRLIGAADSGFQQSTRQMVNTKTAAWIIGVSEDVIRQWVRRGKITRYGTARKAEFDLAELLKIIEVS
ncbi:hypothetical protein ACWDSJ_35365 [Nocardia sp. NPDC003482]